MLVMFDEETEFLANELGQKIALPPAKLRKHIDSKITTTKLGNEAGIQSAPNTMGQAKTYEELCELADRANLGRDLVVQTPYGDSGRTTFFIKSEGDWLTHEEDMVDEELKVMRRINHLPGTVEAVATRHGTLVGPMQTDITGFPEVTPYKGGWCGNDVFTGGMDKERKAVTGNGTEAWQPALQVWLQGRILHGFPDRYGYARGLSRRNQSLASPVPRR
jgi:biotin carboxylase